MAASLRFPPWGKAAEGRDGTPEPTGAPPKELKMLRNLMLRNLLSPHSADVHVMSFRISAYAQYQVTLNHQKKSANVSMAADRIKYHAMRRLANQLYDPPAETLPAPSPSRSGPRPIMDLAMPGGMLIIRSLFRPPDRKSALKVLRNAYICSRRTSPMCMRCHLESNTCAQ